MWTLNDVVFKARRLLQDERAPHRHSDEELVGYVNGAMSEVRRLRPDLLLPSLATYTQERLQVDDLDAALPIEDSYFVSVVDYVVGYASMQDDEFANDGRAAAMLARFTTRLVGKGV